MNNSLTIRLYNAPLYKQYLLNKSPIETKSGRLANKIYLCEYHLKTNYYIYTIKIQWEDILYESLYCAGSKLKLESSEELISRIKHTGLTELANTCEKIRQFRL